MPLKFRFLPSSRIICCWWFLIIHLIYHNLFVLLFSWLLIVSHICDIQIIVIWFSYWAYQLLSATLMWYYFLSWIIMVISSAPCNFLLWAPTSFWNLASSLSIFWLFYRLSSIKSFKWRLFIPCYSTTSFNLLLHYQSYVIWLNFN
jgi:hypothetical protein